MKHFVFQLTCCLVLLALIFSSTVLLSLHHQKEIKALQDLCGELPETLQDGDLTLQKALSLEQKLKKAGTSLAFFTHYEQLNAAYLAASSLCAAIRCNSAGQYSLALCRLKEALGTLSRNESFSLEVLI